MRSNDPNRRLRNFIYQKMEDEIASERRQADLAAQAGQAKVEWLTQEILNDLERSRLQADLDSQKKEEEKQKRILRYQRIQRYVYKHVNDYVHERLNELWDKYQEDEDFRKRINDYVYDRVREVWDKYHESEDFQNLIKESIERILAALDKAYESLKGMAVSETTGSPITDHPIDASWDREGKYRYP